MDESRNEAAHPAKDESYDLLIILDATASMSTYLTALKRSLPQIVSLAALTNCFERIGILAYRDYCCPDDLLEWSGWSTNASQEPQVDLIDFVAKLQINSGRYADYPEAVKTGLAKAYELMRESATTLILVYADAPPHILGDDDSVYYHEEQLALHDQTSYGGFGPLFADWVSAAQTLKNGVKRAQIICMLDNMMMVYTESSMFDCLVYVVGGVCLHAARVHADARSISEVTIQALLAWMGIQKDEMANNERLLGWQMSEYDRELDLEDSDEGHIARLLDAGGWKPRIASLLSSNLNRLVPRRATPLRDLARTYQTDGMYKGLVVTHLRHIIERDVSSVSLNPVFGSLWRAVCNDRQNEGRKGLLDLFGKKVDEIQDEESRAKMKSWLESSYDYTAEVLEAIDSVPGHERFPCVCLDPTLTFEDSGCGEVNTLKRDELLEIGRSCDHRILQRLGRVLTRLTFIESESTMPAHLANDEDLVKIPMALATKQYGEKFWKILLHTVVPGTMLGRRAAAVLAALTIRIGVEPLRQAAEQAMLSWRDRWNNIEVPETWNVSCLSLLLDADAAHRQRNTNGLLRDDDRALFERLIEYKMLELNLTTTITARVAWTPKKTSMAIGPLIVCKSCRFPRSVTVMGPDSVCGICCFYRDYPVHGNRITESDHISRAVAAEDCRETNTIWYECNVPSCRAQYVVYYVEALNVRPKCHYCRAGRAAPVVECNRCTSRMIWPDEYRTEEADAFVCMGCRAEKQTIVDEETSARNLVPENGMDWLLENRNGQIKEVFNNRSLFHIASSCALLPQFSTDVKVLPGRGGDDVQLFLRGKLVQNGSKLLEQIYGWVAKRRAESGQCSLCFTDQRMIALLPACGRSGCAQRVCHGCLRSWYGLNSAGRIINTAALHCPFCRRSPTAKTLARNGMGIHAVRDLKDAVSRSGEWIYAWCIDCGTARQYMERVCAGGAPAELREWNCEVCQTANSANLLLKAKSCPVCGILTEKSGGCDHIKCHCGAHWCFHCGEKQGGEEIYSHMEKEHGGFYGGLQAEEYDSEADE